MKKQKPVLVIGVGVGAKNIIDYLYINEKNFDYLCIDDKKQFVNLSNTKNVWYNGAELRKTKEDVYNHRNAILEKTNILHKELENYNHAVIIANLGERFVLNMMLPVIDYIKQFEMSHCIFAIKPFNFDEAVNDTSDKISEKLTKLGYSLGENLFLYDSEDVYKKHNSISMNEANKYLIDYAGIALKMILELEK